MYIVGFRTFKYKFDEVVHGNKVILFLSDPDPKRPGQKFLIRNDIDYNDDETIIKKIILCPESLDFSLNNSLCVLLYSELASANVVRPLFAKLLTLIDRTVQSEMGKRVFTIIGNWSFFKYLYQLLKGSW